MSRNLWATCWACRTPYRMGDLEPDGGYGKGAKYLCRWHFRNWGKSSVGPTEDLRSVRPA